MRYLFAFLALGFSGPALCAANGEPMAAPQVPGLSVSQPDPGIVVSASNDKEDVGNGARIICRKIEVTGSRMNTKKICATANEWAAQKAQNRQVIEQAQNKKWSAF